MIYTYSEIFLLYHGEQLLIVEETKENWEHQVQVRHTSPWDAHESLPHRDKIIICMNNKLHFIIAPRRSLKIVADIIYRTKNM